ncbi:monoacylglycerol lipase ABHD6 [Oncorhynchus mykiss]|nr:monoacylglycerol lipase ABHD6 [Oncorhynchus mykiss]XP_036840198.1 monoacylglycerol lipase ABHD6 [Oncorhynchus mykiss]
MDVDVVNMFVLAGGTLVIPILAFFASFYMWPAAIIHVYNWYWRRRLGLQVVYSENRGYRFCYSHRGKPGPGRPTILMLHGFSANKDMWLPVAKFLPKHQHLLCIDMPGHEGTSRTDARDYSIEGQVKRIRQFVESVRLTKRPFHLVGTSMGGNVAGVYAARYPNDLCSVTLICPAGLPTESPFVERLRELEKDQELSGSLDPQGIPLIPSTPEEMDDMLKLCSFVRFKIPQQILQGLVDVRVPNNDFYRELFMEIVGEKSRHSLHENMHLITVPTQVIWGKHDQVVDVSGSSMLKEAVSGCQVDLLDNCGHSVVMERPRKTAQLIMDFINNQHNTGSGSNNSKKLS